MSEAVLPLCPAAELYVIVCDRNRKWKSESAVV